MKFYGSLGSIPQLSTFSSTERRRIWRKCLRKAMRSWRFWLIVVLPCLLFVLAYIAVSLFIALRFSQKVFTFYCLLSILICGGLSLIIKHFFIRFMLPYVREELPEFCSSCGYNLTGNTSGVCPECGSEMDSAH